jgi:hypothetical protein
VFTPAHLNALLSGVDSQNSIEHKNKNKKLLLGQPPYLISTKRGLYSKESFVE